MVCLIWVANPNLIKGGYPSSIRFDTKNQVWLYEELSEHDRSWLMETHIEITHFCDDINMPGTDELPKDYTTDTPQEPYNKP